MSEPSSRTGRLRRLTEHSGVRYLVIGGLSFVVDFGLLWALHDLLGVVLWLAAGVAFLASFAVNYTLQRAVSFRSTAGHGVSLLKYCALVGFNTVATAAIVSALGLTPLGWAGGKVVATVATTVWNYFLYRYWVFPASKRDEIAAPGQVVASEPDDPAAREA